MKKSLLQRKWLEKHQGVFMKKVIIEDAWDSFSEKITGIKKFTINLENLCQNLNYNVVKFDKSFLKNIKNPVLMKLVYFFG